MKYLLSIFTSFFISIAVFSGSGGGGWSRLQEEGGQGGGFLP